MIKVKTPTFRKVQTFTEKRYQELMYDEKFINLISDIESRLDGLSLESDNCLSVWLSEAEDLFIELNFQYIRELYKNFGWCDVILFKPNFKTNEVKITFKA